MFRLPYHDRTKAFLTVVFGSPIAVVKQTEPSDEYIEELWQQYITQIKGLYEEYKGEPRPRHTASGGSHRRLASSVLAASQPCALRLLAMDPRGGVF